MDDILDNSFMSKVISDFSEKMMFEKERLVKERLFSLLGYELNIEEESKRTFPRLMIQKHPMGVEKYYWNDGSEYGILLITFYWDDLPKISDDYKMFVGFRYK